jgi:hypothetical protein
MTGSKLYVGNLVYAVTSDELKTLFATYGTVKEATVIERKGFGFVEMTTPEEGRILKVDEAKPKEKGSGGGFGGGSRGGFGGGRGGNRGGDRGGFGGGNVRY